MSQSCEHLSHLTAADFSDPGNPAECAGCVAEGSRWVALRQCQECGHVGCCDSSPQTHATKHHVSTNHPVMRSAMPGDGWAWCYVHEAMGDLSATG